MLSFLFSLFLSILPFYVRLSASDAVHNLVFFYYSMGMLIVANYLTNDKKKYIYLYYIVLFIIIINGAKLRLETFFNFFTYIYFIYFYSQSLKELILKHKGIILTIIISVKLAFLSLFFKNQQLFNNELILFETDYLSQVLIYFKRIISFLIMKNFFDINSFLTLVIPVLFWFNMFILLKQKSYKQIYFIFFSLLLCTPAYILNIGSAEANDMAYSRYIMIVSIFWIIPASNGLKSILLTIKNSKLLIYTIANYIFLFLIVILFLFSINRYNALIVYQEEYLFLKENLPETGNIIYITKPELPFVDDSCLVHPNLLLSMDYPDLSWSPITYNSKNWHTEILNYQTLYSDNYWYESPRIHLHDDYSSYFNMMSSYIKDRIMILFYVFEISRKTHFNQGLNILIRQIVSIFDRYKDNNYAYVKQIKDTKNNIEKQYKMKLIKSKKIQAYSIHFNRFATKEIELKLWKLISN